MITSRKSSTTMDYGPAPEGDERRARLARRATTDGFGHFIGGEFADADGGQYFDVINPATGKLLARVAQGGADGCRRARSRPRARRFQAWAALSGHERARHLYALARHVQKHAPLLRGARDARQRQADPRDARHRHAAGRAPLLPPRRLGRSCWRASSPATRPVGVVRPDHPVELPAADAGLEDRAGARGWATPWC